MIQRRLPIERAEALVLKGHKQEACFALVQGDERRGG
jgi:hypothetical protein